MLKIGVILGTVRRGRFGEKPARWILDELNKHPDIEAELLDLKDYPLPFFDEPVSPGWISEPYQNEVVARWTKKIGEKDGYVMVAPEYNRGYTGVLKNAIDWVYKEWNKKVVGFVSYGSVGGGRAVEQLRTVAVEMQMVPVRQAVHIQWDVYMSMAADSAPVDPAKFKPVEQQAHALIEQLLWYGKALQLARQADHKAKQNLELEGAPAE
ncbi:MAG: NAD(P)H-dependent oxidoreductase [Rhizobiales bacterium]|nr:NAD(P)H-dependent oxidoreductase [Hyphomicrobiales bacterium]MBN9009022.1 NAD(P)H-dependent oxidoreductase [Hyphomicrobiales bacterium]